MTHTPVFVGIDVSKAQLDLALRPEGRFAAPNTEAGIAQVLTRLRAFSPTLVVREATGGLELPLTGAVAAAGLPVVVVHPRQGRDSAKATGKLAALEARISFSLKTGVEPWPARKTHRSAHCIAASPYGYFRQPRKLKKEHIPGLS